MLDARANALALDAAYVGGSDAACKHGVFAVVLEVATAQRRAMDVHTRCQQHIAAVLQDLVADASTDFLNQFCVPC